MAAFGAIILTAHVINLVEALGGASVWALSSARGPSRTARAFRRTEDPYSAGQFLAVACVLSRLLPFILMGYIGATNLMEARAKRLKKPFNWWRGMWGFGVLVAGTFFTWATISLVAVTRWAIAGRPYSNYETASYAWPISEHSVGIAVWGFALGWLATHWPAPDPPPRRRRQRPKRVAAPAAQTKQGDADATTTPPADA